MVRKLPDEWSKLPWVLNTPSEREIVKSVPISYAAKVECSSKFPVAKEAEPETDPETVLLPFKVPWRVGSPIVPETYTSPVREASKPPNDAFSTAARPVKSMFW